MAPSPPDESEPAAQREASRALRTKYDELGRKYHALVRRMNEWGAAERASYRVGLRRGSGAAVGVAIVQNDRLAFANALFSELQTTEGEWQLLLVGKGPRRSYPSLLSLALGQAQRLSGTPRTALLERFVRVPDGMACDIRAERAPGENTGGAVILSCEDVTERVRAEEELSRSREAVFEGERMRLLGQLAAAILHDMGSTLRGIGLHLETIAADELCRAAQGPALANLTGWVDTALQQIRRLQGLATVGRLRVEPADLRALIGEAVNVASVELSLNPAPIRIEVKLPRLPPVFGTNIELLHLFLNLLRNAAQAMPEGGTIRVGGAVRAGEVCISVRDEGTGIAREDVQRIFQPFFTTKGSSGTGLGLWLASGTMTRMGGSISAENGKAGGAAFTLVFPRADGPGSPITPKTWSPPLPRKRSSRPR